MRLYSSELENQNAHPNETEERSRQGVGLPHTNTDQYTNNVKKCLFANTANMILGPTGFFEYRVNAAKAAHEAGRDELHGQTALFYWKKNGDNGMRV
jgi:hypothetical protein